MQFKYHAPVAKRGSELALGGTLSTCARQAVSIRTSEERCLYTEEVLYREVRGEDTHGDTGRECQGYEVLRTAPLTWTLGRTGTCDGKLGDKYRIPHGQQGRCACVDAMAGHAGRNKESTPSHASPG